MRLARRAKALADLRLAVRFVAAMQNGNAARLAAQVLLMAATLNAVPIAAELANTNPRRAVMGKRSQQQKAHHKQRKAKARAKHEAERGQWDRRIKAKVKAKSRAPINPFAGPAMSMMAVEAMIQRWERQDEVNRFIFTGGHNAD